MSVAIVTPTPSSEPICHSGVINLETYGSLFWSCGITITVGICQRGMLPLRIPLQSSTKCTSDIKTHRTTVTFDMDDSAIIENGSPAPVCTQRTSQETRSRSLTHIPSVSKPILKTEGVVTSKSTLDNALVWIGCTWMSFAIHAITQLALILTGH